MPVRWYAANDLLALLHILMTEDANRAADARDCARTPAQALPRHP